MSTNQWVGGDGWWIKKDGARIRIVDMTDDHLTNSIAILERAAKVQQREVLLNPPCFQGEMAQYYADQEWEQALKEGDDPAFYYPVYEDLVAERKRRTEKGAEGEAAQ